MGRQLQRTEVTVVAKVAIPVNHEQLIADPSATTDQGKMGSGRPEWG